MPIEVNDIQFFHSGGAGNTSGAGSLGGAISSTRITSQTASAPVNVTGVTINWVVNNAEGSGILAWASSTNTLSWKPPGSLTTYSLNITANGQYTLGGSDGQIVVTVVFASVPTSFKQDSITVSNSLNNVFDAVSAADSLVGDTEYRCIYVKNNHATLTANGVKLFIAQLTSGPDEIDIGLDPAGIGGTATTVANENTAPAGVTFSRPTVAASGLAVGNLAPGQSFAFWQRRTVPANTTGNISQNTSKIGVALTA